MHRQWIWLAVAGLLCAGCEQKNARLNAPPHGSPEATSPLQGTFVYMTDNALLADMTVSDLHFMPHRPLLNQLGEERLSRLALLMDAYGGTIRLSTDEEDRALVDARLETVRHFLSEAGIDTTTEVLTEDMAGGRGMRATEVMLIREKEGTYIPPKSSGTGAGAGQ